MTSEARSIRLAMEIAGRLEVDVGVILAAIREAESEALERAAAEVETGFILVDREAPWDERRRALADRVRSLKHPDSRPVTLPPAPEDYP